MLPAADNTAADVEGASSRAKGPSAAAGDAKAARPAPSHAHKARPAPPRTGREGPVGDDDSDSEIDPGSDGEDGAVYANAAAAAQSTHPGARPAGASAAGEATPTAASGPNAHAFSQSVAAAQAAAAAAGGSTAGAPGGARAAGAGGGRGGGGDEDGDEEEEDEEPKLKYQRLGSSVGTILNGQAAGTGQGAIPATTARCLAAHEKFLVLGTANGSVHLLDLNGNEIMKLQPHTSAINDMSLDGTGDFLASGSADGTVVITNLFNREQTRHNYYAAIRAVAMPGNYAQEQKFASGGSQRQFIINTKGWFSTKDNVIHAGEGSIHAIRWRTSLIAWANHLGVKIFDSATNEKITYIARGTGAAGEVLPPPDMYRCNLCWAEDNTLLIGWGNSVKIGLVKTKSGMTPTSGAQRYVQIVALFTTDFFISGIAPFKDFLVLLAYVEDDEDDAADDNTTTPRLTGPSPAGASGTAADAASPNAATASASSAATAAASGQRPDAKSGEPAKRPTPPNAQQPNATGKPPAASAAAPTGAAAAAAAGAKPPPPKQRPGQRPELRIISWTNSDISSDALPIHGFQNYRATDYRLEYLKSGTDPKTSESLFYIVSPKDIVVARSRDIDDHITWLLQRSRFEDALIAAQQNRNTLRVHKLLDVGERYLQHLLSIGEDERAARYCPELLMGHQGCWEAWVLVYAKSNKLKLIAPYMPTSNPKLSDEMYEMVLLHFVNEDPEGLLRTIKEWSALRLYNVTTVINAVLDKLKTDRNRFLTESLAELYILNKQYGLALHEYLRLGRKDVFEFIVKFDLFDAVKDKVLSLMLFDKPKAIDLLTANSERIPVAAVVAQLEADEQLQHDYLHALFTRGNPAGEKYHELQVRLYAKYDRPHLLTFLRNSNSYILEEAFEICQAANYYAEMVFLLERMGEYRAALSFIIDKLCDVRQAIAFVEEHKDDQLWEELITRSLVSPEFLSNLLEHVGSHNVDLKKLISRIPDDLPIPDLKQKLVNIMSDCHVQVNVRKGCNNILKGDCVALSARLHRVRRAAVRVDVDRRVRCGLCDGPLFVGKIEPVACFFCQHSYHASCIESHRSTKAAAAAAAAGGAAASTSANDRSKAAAAREPPHCARCSNRYAHGIGMAGGGPAGGGLASITSQMRKKPIADAAATDRDTKSADSKADTVAPLRMGGAASSGGAGKARAGGAATASTATAAAAASSSSTPKSTPSSASRKVGAAVDTPKGASASTPRAAPTREFDVSRYASELNSSKTKK